MFDIRLIPFQSACAAVGLWHRHHTPPIAYLWCHGAVIGAEVVAVAIVGRATARMLARANCVEVLRVATPGVSIDPRCRGAASALYRAAAREAEVRGFPRIVTYTLEHEDGYSLRAARWHPTATTTGGSWTHHVRPGYSKPELEGPKTRWEPRRRLASINLSAQCGLFHDP